MSYPKRTDANQSTIAADLRRAGCQVKDLHIVGRGVPDLLAAHHNARPAGQNWLFECKVKGGRFTEDETEFFRDWPGQKAVVYDALDALAIMGLLKEAA